MTNRPSRPPAYIPGITVANTIGGSIFARVRRTASRITLLNCSHSTFRKGPVVRHTPQTLSTAIKRGSAGMAGLAGASSVSIIMTSPTFPKRLSMLLIVMLQPVFSWMLEPDLRSNMDIGLDGHNAQQANLIRLNVEGLGRGMPHSLVLLRVA